MRDQYIYFGLYASMAFLLLLAVVMLLGKISRGRTVVALSTFVLFLIGLYMGTGSLLGRPKPILEIPIGWDDFDYNDDQVFVVGGYIGEKTMYLLIQTTEGQPRYVQMENVSEITAEMKKALKKNKVTNGKEWGFYLNQKKLKEAMKSIRNSGKKDNKRNGSLEDRPYTSGIFQIPPPQEPLVKPEQQQDEMPKYLDL
jgi:hypothetical protein